MFGLNLLKIFILLSSIQIFMIPGVLCLPRSASQPSGPETAASSSNPALEVRGNLEKRDSWDCKGSSSCGMVKASACIEALEAFLRSNKNNRSWDKVWGPIRHWRSYNSYNTGKCLAMYTCGDSRDYESAARAGVATIGNLMAKGRSIYDEELGNCKRCGSVWFWGSCRVTFNYCHNNCAGT
ncbi:hypothetical protein TWF106_000816 [Orbilia oligospora]|uniref:Killer toxin Kp4 domain-containing protein n=2 Tax=Orbilia oligospora TaxID=2813651 RepID=A0A6G1MB64_ORBOL|nr:hypothetical protein TWF679_004219 [Orbilia oligospora]KAF3226321.1 hypothetical protein TWF106_000816 [Orbilia oligospora]KAF3250690.1 hypothetical protein TWF192_005129 [Orbilia oligospora]